MQFLRKAERKQGRTEFALEEKGKRLFERIGLCHTVKGKKILVKEEDFLALEKTLGLEKDEKKVREAVEKSVDVIAALNLVSGIPIRNLAGTWIGARMGRPEASRPRKMTGNPHVLFPIGFAGGNTRSINKAMTSNNQTKEGSVSVEIALYKCPKCDSIREQQYCKQCNARTEKISICPNCGKTTKGKTCPKCGIETEAFSKRSIALSKLVQEASENLSMKVPELVKGVKGMINKGKVAEPLEKGLLRAKYDLHIFRDATIRYEAINACLTHFKPKELNLSVEKAKQLGYEKDTEGKKLEKDNQVLEIMPQDIVINEKAGDFFVKVSKFIDELLVRFYKMQPYFNATKKEDLIGQLTLGLAPHTSAAAIGRILGFSKARACYAHPYLIQTRRRNCDGDQDSLMLLIDTLLNFSHSYLPASRGGRMDAPLVFTVALKPTEIDNECYEMETGWDYPLELYENSQKIVQPNIESIPRVEHILGKEGQYSGLGFTHQVEKFDAGPTTSRYVQLATMEEKLRAQAKLQNRIEAVDGKDALERTMVTHLLPDIIGNARAFSRQSFRCTKCNAKIRRIPLDGKCPKCREEKIILTVNEGGVRKYLGIAKSLAAEFELSPYLRQRLELVNQEIDSVFQNQQPEQKKLVEYV
jgi:DNA polymerase II large subunit